MHHGQEEGDTVLKDNVSKDKPKDKSNIVLKENKESRTSKDRAPDLKRKGVMPPIMLATLGLKNFEGAEKSRRCNFDVNDYCDSENNAKTTTR